MGPGAGGAAPCIPFGVGLGFGVCGAGVYIVLLAGKYKNRRRAWGRIFYTPNGIAGIRHAADFIFRGYFYSGPDSRYLGNVLRPGWLVFCSALVYVLNHIYRLGDGWLLLSHLFVLGILLVIPLVRTGNLGATLGIHWG